MLTVPPTGPIPDGPLLIGDVAELTGLSLRSIRHYEEMGLAVADSRTTGGFRVFGAEAVERLRLVMMLRLMGMSLEDIQPLIVACRAAETGDPTLAADADSLAEAQARVAEGLVALEQRVDIARLLAKRLGKAARASAATQGEAASADA